MPDENNIGLLLSLFVIMTGCSAMNCKNRSNEGYSFHRFPKNVNLRQIWIDNSKVKSFCNGSRLCSQHFSENQWFTGCRRKTLKQDAIPTLFSIKSKDDEAISLTDECLTANLLEDSTKTN